MGQTVLNIDVADQLEETNIYSQKNGLNIDTIEVQKLYSKHSVLNIYIIKGQTCALKQGRKMRQDIAKKK